MVGIYFSGTGNTEFCINKFMALVDDNAPIVSIEKENVISEIQKHEHIIFAYPIYYSDLPKIVYDFITQNCSAFYKKKIYIICTMGLFSGDGAGCSARLFKKYGADIIGGLHIKMPDCICDVKALKRPLEKNKEIVSKAEVKISLAAKRFLEGHPTREGLNVLYHIAGLFGQRLWFYHKTWRSTNMLKIDHSRCINCNACINACPVKNLNLRNNSVITNGNCTMCYRCANACPRQAITILGKNVICQGHIGDYIQ